MRCRTHAKFSTPFSKRSLVFLLCAWRSLVFLCKLSMQVIWASYQYLQSERLWYLRLYLVSQLLIFFNYLPSSTFNFFIIQFFLLILQVILRQDIIWSWDSLFWIIQRLGCDFPLKRRVLSSRIIAITETFILLTRLTETSFWVTQLFCENQMQSVLFIVKVCSIYLVSHKHWAHSFYCEWKLTCSQLRASFLIFLVVFML